jgi:hypothetical protein
MRNTVRDLATYENMDVIYASLAHDRTAQAVLVSLWRKQVWGMATMEHLRRVQAMVPEFWRDMVAVTVPNINVLNRWESDHGYVSR